MADHAVGARDDSHESEASQALMFCFDIVFQESLASLLSIWSLCFALPTRFSAPECHRKRVKSSTAEKETEKKNTISVLFFSFLVSFASEGKPKRRRQGDHDRQS